MTTSELRRIRAELDALLRWARDLEARIAALTDDQ